MEERQAILDKIEKIKNNPSVPEKFKPAMIKRQEDLLAKLDSSSTTVKTESKQKVSSKPEVSKTSAKSKKKAEKPKPVKPEYKVSSSGKSRQEVPCDELLKEYLQNKVARKKANKKYRVKPVIEKVTSNVITAVKQAVKNMSAEDIKANPKKEINKVKALEKLTLEYLHGFKSILGEDYDSGEINEELKEITELAKQMEKKYGKAKLVKGGQAENQVWDVFYYDKDDELIDETQIDEKSEKVAWDLFKEFGHTKKKGT